MTLNFNHFNLKVANIYYVNVMLRNDSTTQLQTMILSRNKIYSWKPPVLLWVFGLRRLKTCLRGFRSIWLDKNWSAQSQKPQVLAYSNRSNHTFQVANNKSLDQTAQLICTFIVNTCFVCVEVLRPSQPNGVMSSAVSLPNHTFTGQA